MSYNIQALPAIEKFRAASAKLPSAKRFSKQDLEAVYTHAYNLFQQQKYADALVMFGFLTTYDPTSAKYRKGTAACHKLLGQYVEAEQHYSFLLLLDPNDPEPAVSCAECLIRLGNLKDALVTLEGAVALARNAGRGDLEQRAQAMLAAANKAA